MKPLFEISQTLNLLRGSRRSNIFAPVEIQALEWAYETIENEGLSRGEEMIKTRIFKLKYRQEKREVMSFATRPARAKQINALKWVINEMEIDHFEPLY